MRTAHAHAHARRSPRWCSSLERGARSAPPPSRPWGGRWTCWPRMRTPRSPGGCTLHVHP